MPCQYYNRLGESVQRLDMVKNPTNSVLELHLSNARHRQTQWPTPTFAPREQKLNTQERATAIDTRRARETMITGGKRRSAADDGQKLSPVGNERAREANRIHCKETRDRRRERERRLHEVRNRNGGAGVLDDAGPSKKT